MGWQRTPQTAGVKNKQLCRVRREPATRLRAPGPVQGSHSGGPGLLRSLAPSSDHTDRSSLPRLRFFGGDECRSRSRLAKAEARCVSYRSIRNRPRCAPGRFTSQAVSKLFASGPRRSGEKKKQKKTKKSKNKRNKRVPLVAKCRTRLLPGNRGKGKQDVPRPLKKRTVDAPPPPLTPPPPPHADEPAHSHAALGGGKALKPGRIGPRSGTMCEVSGMSESGFRFFPKSTCCVRWRSAVRLPGFQKRTPLPNFSPRFSQSPRECHRNCKCLQEMRSMHFLWLSTVPHTCDLSIMLAYTRVRH